MKSFVLRKKIKIKEVLSMRIAQVKLLVKIYSSPPFHVSNL